MRRDTFHVANYSRGRIVIRDPDLGAPGIAEFNNMLSDLSRHVDGYGESKARMGIGRSDVSGIDAHELALQVNERATRTSWIDARIGLNEVFVLFDAETGAMQPADDTRRHAFADIGRIADGNNEVANSDTVGIAIHDGGQIVGLHFDHSDVCGRIGTDDVCLQFASIGENDRYFVSAIDDMIVGDDQTAGGVEHHPGAGTILVALGRDIGWASLVPTILRRRTQAFRGVALNYNADNGW